MAVGIPVNPLMRRPTGPMQGQRPGAPGGVPAAGGPATMQGPSGTLYQTPEGGYSAAPPVTPSPMPQMMRDPNSGNLFQWQAEGRPGWSKFSSGDGGDRFGDRGDGGGATGQRAAGGFDALANYSRAEAMMPKALPRVAAPDPANRQRAEAAAFSRAKDRIGLATQGLMKSVGSQFESRGIGGSSLEADAIESGLGQGQGAINDLIREQAIGGLTRDYDVEDRDYATNVQQRGQDIGQQAQKQDAIMALMRMISQGAY